LRAAKSSISCIRKRKGGFVIRPSLGEQRPYQTKRRKKGPKRKKTPRPSRLYTDRCFCKKKTKKKNRAEGNAGNKRKEEQKPSNSHKVKKETHSKKGFIGLLPQHQETGWGHRKCEGERNNQLGGGRKQKERNVAFTRTALGHLIQAQG